LSLLDGGEFMTEPSQAESFDSQAFNESSYHQFTTRSELGRNVFCRAEGLFAQDF
jgi:hypothetical protein